MSLLHMGIVMNREETPVWLKRRLDRHVAKGKDSDAAQRAILNINRAHMKTKNEIVPNSSVTPLSEMERLLLA